MEDLARVKNKKQEHAEDELVTKGGSSTEVRVVEGAATSTGAA